MEHQFTNLMHKTENIKTYINFYDCCVCNMCDPRTLELEFNKHESFIFYHFAYGGGVDNYGKTYNPNNRSDSLEVRVHLQHLQTVTFENVIFSNIKSDLDDYGLIFIDLYCDVIIKNCTFKNNTNFADIIHCDTSSYGNDPLVCHCVSMYASISQSDYASIFETMIMDRLATVVIYFYNFDIMLLIQI